jgi:hypothetical protein
LKVTYCKHRALSSNPTPIKKQKKILWTDIMYWLKMYLGPPKWWKNKKAYYSKKCTRGWMWWHVFNPSYTESWGRERSCLVRMSSGWVFSIKGINQ